MTDFAYGLFRQNLAAAVRAAFLAAPIAGMLAGSALAAPDINGVWKTPEGALVEIKACGKAPCGRIIDFPPPKGYTVRTTPDLNNRDTSKRSRKILGLKVLWRLEPAADSWTGRAYDPRRGFSANTTVRKRNATTLDLKGCVRVVFNVCEEETWRKVR